MAQNKSRRLCLTGEEVYCGEKYDVLSAVGADLLQNGCPKNYDTQTWLEMLSVRATSCSYTLLIAAEKIKKERPTPLEIADLIIKAVIETAALITAIKWW